MNPPPVRKMEKVAIIKCGNYSIAEIKTALTNSFDHFGGIDRFVKPGERVLLKPNLIAASKRRGETTDARFIEAVIEIIKECRATPFIGDSPAFGSAQGVAKSVGIRAATERQAVQVVEFKNNFRLESDVFISRSVKDFDKIINLPKLKAHSQFRFTGATKNLYGFTQGKIKAWRHFAIKNDMEKFCLMILKVYDFVKPTFTLVDAIDIMEKTGPRGGPMRHYGFVFSGMNCLSIDRVMSECLGIKVPQAPLLQTAEKHGFQGVRLDQIKIMGQKIENTILHDYEYPQTLRDISFTFPGVIKSVFRHLWLKAVKERV